MIYRLIPLLTIVGGLLAVALLGCANPAVNNSVAALEISLTAAETLATNYVALPRCPAAAVCSDPATVSKIKSLDQQAYTAVKAAEADSTLISTAIAAVSAFQTSIPAKGP